MKLLCCWFSSPVLVLSNRRPASLRWLHPKRAAGTQVARALRRNLGGFHVDAAALESRDPTMESRDLATTK